ncbi:VCBS repeat-containing protein [bacterium]|nr:VCBS repeat-containing protein [bacterium]
MNKLQKLVAGLSLLITVGCGSTGSSSSSDSGSGSNSSAQFSFAGTIAKTLASGSGGADSGQIVSVGDYNQDGKSDFAVLNRSLGSLSVFLSNGTDFASEQLANTVASPLSVTSSDLNSDGAPDLVVVSATAVSFLFNDGSGNFPSHLEVSLGSANQVVASADFDSDGKNDVAVGDAGATPLHILFGNGGNDPSQYVLVDYAQSNGAVQNPQAMINADLDNDGRQDLVFGNGVSTLAAWYNRGATRASLFGSADVTAAGLSLPSGTSARGVACADFNGDGRRDIMASGVTTNSDGFVELFLNGTSGFFPNSMREASPDQQLLTLGDFNLDGFMDAVSVSRVGANTTGNGELDFFLGDGAGSLSGQITYALGIRLAALANGDFNADGRPDLVASGTGSAFVLLNTSSR